MPDTYQGTELWDLTLVDPDNRRPVDFAPRLSWLEQSAAPSELLGAWRDGRIKQHVIARALALRRRRPELFSAGRLPAARDERRAGRAHRRLRAPRPAGARCSWSCRASSPPLLPEGDGLLPPAAAWADTALELPEGWAGARVVDELTGRAARAAGRRGAAGRRACSTSCRSRCSPPTRLPPETTHRRRAKPEENAGMLELNTFSIAARCARTGMVGVAVATAVPAVGAICPHARAGVGAVVTQAWTNPYLGIDGLALLAEGLPAGAALAQLIEGDPGRDRRQLGLVDREGNGAAWTGQACTPWCGHRTGQGYAVQGNMLVGEPTLAAMAEAFERAAALDLPERLLVVLEAGEAAGGDRRGRQSAALKVMWREDYPWLDLRVDEHRDPTAELRRIFEVARHQLLPFVAGMPTRANPQGTLPATVAAMLQSPPADRPGGGGAA